MAVSRADSATVENRFDHAAQKSPRRAPPLRAGSACSGPGTAVSRRGAHRRAGGLPVPARTGRPGHAAVSAGGVNIFVEIEIPS